MRNTTAWIDITPTGSTAAGSTAVGSTVAGSTAAGITPTTITSAFAPGEFFLFYIKSSLMDLIFYDAMSTLRHKTFPIYFKLTPSDFNDFGSEIATASAARTRACGAAVTRQCSATTGTALSTAG